MERREGGGEGGVEGGGGRRREEGVWPTVPQRLATEASVIGLAEEQQRVLEENLLYSVGRMSTEGGAGGTVRVGGRRGSARARTCLRRWRGGLHRAAG